MAYMENEEYRSPTLFYRYRNAAPWSRSTGGSHTHNLFELIYFLHGDASHIVEERKYPLAKGDLIIVRPQTYHDIVFSSERNYERYNILFDAEALGLSRAFTVSDRFEVVSLSAEPTIASVFPRLEHYRSHLSEAEFGDAATHLLAGLFYDLSLLEPQDERPYAMLHPILAGALSYIRENLFTVKSVGEVAEVLHVTESYLFRLFRIELKTSPKRYITDKRLVAAERLIRLGGRPSEVALSCGFSEYTTFFRAFKGMFGVAPSAK